MVKGTVAAGEFSRTYVQAKASAEKSAAGGKGGPRFYPADDVKVPIAKKIVNKPTKLRASITPGTVLILLTGRFKGKRVVYLKQLPSGLLLVAGPYKVNGVPVRRVNQAYVIATSTQVKLPALDLAKFDDAYFKAAEKKQKNTKTEGDFMETEEAKKELAAEYLASQKAVDDALAGALSEEMKGYLGDLFSLNDGDRPHLMKF